MKSHGVNVPALKTDVAFTLLKYRATAYTTMFDVTKPHVDEIDHSTDERPRSSAFRSCAFTTVDFGSPANNSTRHTRRSGPV